MSSSPSTLTSDAWGAFTGDEENRIQELLRVGLPKQFVKQRAGGGGKKVDYLEGGAQLEIANHVFGALNWSSRVVHLEFDYCRHDKDYWHCGASSLVRVQVKSGALHEDIGYGVSKDRDQGQALERAKKAAVTDARKRALRCFGELLGNSLKHKDDNSAHLQENHEVQGSPSSNGAARQPPPSSSSHSSTANGARPPARALSPPRAVPSPAAAPPMPLQPLQQPPAMQPPIAQPILPSSAHKPPAAHTRQQHQANVQQQQQQQLRPQVLQQQQQQPQQQPSSTWSVGGRVPMAPPGVPVTVAGASPRTSVSVAPPMPPRPGSDPGGALLEKAPNPAAELGFEYSTAFSTSSPDP